LGDFGSAKSIEKSIAKTVTGTLGYMSPEMIRIYFYNAELKIDEKTDIWYIYKYNYKKIKLIIYF
jgi:serine/threonine protein kinase